MVGIEGVASKENSNKINMVGIKTAKKNSNKINMVGMKGVAPKKNSN